MKETQTRIIETLRGWGDGMDYPEALFELLSPMFASHFCVADAARASAITLKVAEECVAFGGYSSSRIVERLREEGLAVTMSDLYPHALNLANAVHEEEIPPRAAGMPCPKCSVKADLHCSGVGCVGGDECHNWECARCGLVECACMKRLR